MMKTRKLTRRQRRLLITCIIVGIVGIVSIVGIFYRRPPSRYNPEERVEGITAELERNIPDDYPRVHFTEVSKEAGLSFRHFFGDRSTQLPEDMGSGAAWGDYDNDGDVDLFVVNICGPLTDFGIRNSEFGFTRTTSGLRNTQYAIRNTQSAQSPAYCKLFKNNGNGTFTDVTIQANLRLLTCGMGAAWGDYNGDGWLDLIITAYPDIFLFRNNKNGTFTDVSKSSGVSKFKGFWTGTSWADYDKDGDMDVYVCGYVRFAHQRLRLMVKYRFNPAEKEKTSLQYEAEIPFTLNPSSYEPERNLLLRNNGNGVFTEVAQKAGVDNPTGRSLSAAWCDFDEDGFSDLYVANDVSDNAMFKNLGNGKFADVSYSAAVADYRGAMGLGIGDWDNDEDFDIFITHWIAQENALFTNMLIPFRGKKPGRLFFMDVADQHGLGQIALDFIGWGTSFIDYDNDGKLDLFVVNGSTFQDEKDKRKLIPMRHLLFWNKGEESGFFEVSALSGEIFQFTTVGRGAAFADYDNDGDIDIAIVNHSDRLWLLRNDGGNKNRWLKVRARGAKNRFGVGAKVKIMIGDMVQTQQIGAQSSYLSQNPFDAHFGVGEARQVDKLQVIFPSGKVVELQGVETNQSVEVWESD